MTERATPLIDVRQLSKHFGSQVILRELSFSLFQGEFMAIEGPSGCGKSTLLSVLGLLDLEWQGDYQLSQLQVKTLNKRQLAAARNQHIGWIFQNFNLIGELTVLDNVMLPMRYGNFGSASLQQDKARAVLESVGLADKAASYPHALSGGQQQRVAIARALVTAPSILFADEPTGNLDSASAAMVFELLTQLNRQGMTIVMVTHDSQLAAKCSARLKMQDGQILQTIRSSSLC
jgi:putative ABC transport system ATP-binding protein